MAIEAIPEDQAPDQVGPSFADLLPEDATVFSGDPTPIASPESAASNDGALPDSAPPPRKKVVMSKKMKKAMDKFMRQIAETPTLYFKQMTASNPEWALDEEEEDMLTESVAMVFELLDVGFEIEPLNLKLQSIWWIISCPFFVFGYVFLTKKQRVDSKPKDDHVV